MSEPTELGKLADHALDQAARWEAAGPPRAAASTEVCQRHADDWDALHTLVLDAGAWIDVIWHHWAPESAIQAEEDAVAAARRLAAHLPEAPHE